MGYNLKLSERLLLLARPEGKSSGSGHNWPLRTDLSRITQQEATRSAQAVHSLCKIRVLTNLYFYLILLDFPDILNIL